MASFRRGFLMLCLTAGSSPAAADDACTPPTAAAAPTWVGRTLTTGSMPGPESLTTFSLTQTGDRATVFVTYQRANKRGLDAGQWKCEQAATLTGTLAATKGAVSRYELADAGKTYEMTCTRRALRVAPATATRVAIPSEEEGCKKHRWAARKRVRVNALVCTIDGEFLLWPGHGGTEHAVFASRGAGLEQLTIDEDDCWDPVDSLRLVPRNGSFARAKK